MKGRYHKEKQNNMFIRKELNVELNITPEEELKPKNVPELCDELNMLLNQISTKTTDLGISLVPRFPISTGSSGIGMPSTSLTRCLEFMVNISNNINNNLSIILESVK
jgi:hypothetical protein